MIKQKTGQPLWPLVNYKWQFFFFYLFLTTCLQLIEGVQPPEGFGWQRDEGSWTPVWTLLPEVAKASQDLIKCGCKVEPLCSRRCKCHEAGLPCTTLCHCSGMCHTLQANQHVLCKYIISNIIGFIFANLIFAKIFQFFKGLPVIVDNYKSIIHGLITNLTWTLS